MTAAERARQRNEEMWAWVAEGDGRGGGTLVEEQSYWEEGGIVTGDDLDRYLTWCNYSDSYKDYHGIRPRWTSWQNHSLIELDAMCKGLHDGAKWELERAAEALAMIDRKTKEALDATPLKAGTFADVWPKL